MNRRRFLRLLGLLPLVPVVKGGFVTGTEDTKTLCDKLNAQPNLRRLWLSSGSTYIQTDIFQDPHNFDPDAYTGEVTWTITK